MSTALTLVHLQDKERGSASASLDDALRALSRRAVELETLARRLQADLRAAQEQLAEFVDAEERANYERTQPRARPERRPRVDPREPRVGEHDRDKSDVSAPRGRIVPLRRRDTATPAAARRDDALEHRKALAAEMRVILDTLLRDALGPAASRTAAAASRTAAPPSPPRPRTVLRAPATGRTTRRAQVPPTKAITSAPDPVRPAIDDRRPREIAPRPTETKTATDTFAAATSWNLELIPSAAEPPAGALPPAVEPPPAEQPVVAEQPTLEELPGPLEILPDAGESMPNEMAPIVTADVPTMGHVTEMGSAVTESSNAAQSPTPASDTEFDAGHALADVDLRLKALAEAATDAPMELTVEDFVAEPRQPLDRTDEVFEEPTSAASSDLDPLWASTDATDDVAPVTPIIDQPTAGVDLVSDPWAIDVPAETDSPRVDESAATQVDSSTSLDADGASTSSREDVIKASPIEPPAQFDPGPTIPIDTPAAVPRATLRELQVVLSPLGSFPELLRLQARIGSLSSVHTIRLRDFRSGIATFSVGVTEALTGREFGAVLQMFTELRLRLEGAGENTVELRVDPEVP